jgi:protein phosphatase
VALDFDLGGRTNIGQRDRNEDQFVVARLERSVSVQGACIDASNNARIVGGASGWLLLVADGMGGMGAGDIASATVVRSLLKQSVTSIDWLEGNGREPIPDERIAGVARGLVSAVQRCKQALMSRAKEAGATKSMGSTLTLAYIVRDRLIVVHAGDSRAYLVRKGTLRRLTRDHTVADKMVETGAMKPEDVETSRWRHMLYNVVGATPDASVTPDIVHERLLAEDVLLLCSDGLVKSVPDALIRSIAANHESAQSAADALVERSLHDGEKDNVTVVVARASLAKQAAADSTVIRRR